MKALEVLLMNLGGLWNGIRQDFNLLELALIAAGIVAWKKGWRPAVKIPPRFERPWRIALLLAIGTVAVRLALVPLLPLVRPVVTDEFSHLLLADTLAHGRTTNPTHQFWEHFESMHIIMRPVYASNYFPGPALFFAAGKLAFSTPWAGVLAECTLFLVALFWMLRGWMPARWALFGVLLAALRFGIGSYWVNAFHGGFLGAIGGSLLLGAVPRLFRKPTWVGGLTLGAGLGVLIWSRPYEGALFSIPPVLSVAWRLRGTIAPLAKVAIAATLVTGLAAAGLGAYLYSVTGSPFVTAYHISAKEYGWPSAYAWSVPPKVQHRHLEFVNFYKYESSEREKVSGPVNLLEYASFHMQEYWRFFLGPALSIPLVMIGHVWRRRKILLAAIGAGIAAVSLEGGAMAHYLSPATSAIIAIVVECSRHMFAVRIGIPRLLPAAMALVLVLRIAAQNMGLPYTQEWNFQSWCCEVQGNQDKAHIIASLEKIPGSHLVIVRPKTDEYNILQWIYNDADIDASRIVWARDMGAEKNAALMKYFDGRQVWIVDPNLHPATLERLTDGGNVFAERNAPAGAGR